MKRYSRYSQWSDLDEAQEREAEEQAKTATLVNSSLLAKSEKFGRARIESARFKIVVQVSGIASSPDGIAIITPGGEISITHVGIDSFVRERNRLQLDFGGGQVTVEVESAK